MMIREPSFKVGNKNEWILDSRMIYQTRDSDIISIPKGFTTDFATIPRLARVFIPVNGKHRLAAVVHDWLWEPGGREYANKIFREFMLELGVKPWRIKMMYAAVKGNAKRLRLLEKWRK